MASGELIERIAAEAKRALEAPLPAGLYLVATPIGNLGDITLRALSILARAAYVYCEDTRRSRTLLGHYAIATGLRSYHDHNAAAERPRILAALADGKAISLICDAGTPLISDPGLKLVRAALDAGHRVECIPGASAVLAALTSSGLPTDMFFFAGFLPPKRDARRKRIAALAREPGTLILFEAPSRVAATLADLAEGLGSARPAAVARELTKLHEEIMRGTLSQLANKTAARDLKGECVILAGPAETAVPDDAEIVAYLRQSLKTATVRDAAQTAAVALGVTKTRAYALALAIQGEDT
jgi:16S rRNA (cytidine1402-2'-O)-methyltransferase